MKIKFQAFIIYIFLSIFYEIHEASSRTVQNRFSKCSKCPPGWGVAQKCTKEANTLCERCEAGRTYSSQHSSKSPCWTCSRCGIGLYEAHKCTSIRDTVCNECISYIDHKNFEKVNDFTEKCSYMFLHR